VKGILNKIFLGTFFEINQEDKINQFVIRSVGQSVLALLLFLLMLLLWTSAPSLKHYGLAFFTSSNWNPLDEEYGGLAFIYGTLLTSFLALVMATPFCVALALFITEMIHPKLRGIFSFLVEMLAAIPSIIYGMWALFVLAPLIKEWIYPATQRVFGNAMIFQGPSFGIGIFAASIVLAIMISPIITAVTIEIFKTIPKVQKHAALALGATRWEMFRIAILKTGLRGIVGAMALGLGRALGETMAVAMVIGNNPEIKYSLYATGATMASIIANEYAEAMDELHLSSLTALALVLFVITFIVNLFARYIVMKTEAK
jgi:phosphate transport system permease protein